MKHCWIVSGSCDHSDLFSPPIGAASRRSRSACVRHVCEMAAANFDRPITHSHNHSPHHVGIEYPPRFFLTTFYLMKLSTPCAFVHKISAHLKFFSVSDLLIITEAALAVSAAAHEEHAAASERALRDLRIHVKMKEVRLRRQYFLFVFLDLFGVDFFL